MEKLAIVIPMANEEDTAISFLEHLIHIVRKRIKIETSIYLVVDDYSTDRTWDILREMALQYSELNPSYFAESTGLASCYIHGYKLAMEDGADYIIEMDAGHSHPPDRLTDILLSLRGGYDAVFMSRFLLPGGYRGPLVRKLISIGGTILFNKYLGYNLSDATSGFHGFRRELIEKINFDSFISKGHFFQTELKFHVITNTVRIKELPFFYVASESSFKGGELVDSLKILRKLKRNKPKQFKIML